MQGRTHIKISVLLFVFVATFHLSNGFATEKCQHDQLVSETQGVIKCLDKTLTDVLAETTSVWNNLKGFLKIIQLTGGITPEERMSAYEYLSEKLCPIYQKWNEETILCLKDLVGTCFDETLNYLFYEASTTFTLDCKRQDMTREEMVRKLYIFLGKATIATGFNLKGYFKSLIRFDKNCDVTEKTLEYLSWKYRCFEAHFDDLWKAIAQSIHRPPYNGSYPNYRVTTRFPSTPRLPKSLPICKAMKGILESCFQEDQCFSQQEMDFFHGVTEAGYKMYMKGLSQTSEDIGGFYKFELEMQPLIRFEENGIMAQVMDLAVEDYEKSTCKTDIELFSQLS